MGDQYLNIIKKSFRELNLIYAEEFDRIKVLRAFNYEEEITEFYKKVLVHFRAIEPLVNDNETKFNFFDEVEANVKSEDYFKRIDLIFERQFACISKYEESIYLYFNDQEYKDLVNDLKKRFDYIKIPENFPTLFSRNENEMEGITTWLTGEHENHGYDILEMIFEQDLKIYEAFGSTPNDMHFANLSKLKFTHSAQLYYIHIFSNLEQTLKEALPQYNRKLISNHFLTSDVSNCIYLRQQYKNTSFKLMLFDFLVKQQFIECNYEEFESVFHPSEKVINWKGTQKQLILLFKGNYGQSLTDPTIDVTKAVAKRFVAGSIPLKIKQLRVSHQHALHDPPTGVIYDFLEKLKD